MFNYSCNKAEKESPGFGKYWFNFNLRHLRLCRRFAVPDKIIGLALVLDFIDRCTQMLVLHLPPAADNHFAQSKRSTKLSHIRQQWDYTTYS